MIRLGDEDFDPDAPNWLGSLSFREALNHPSTKEQAKQIMEVEDKRIMKEVMKALDEFVKESKHDTITAN